MATYHIRQDGRGKAVSDYWPLIALVGISAMAALALSVQGMSWMPAFMGVFLIIFALLKIFDLNGFRRGFKMYDLLAQRVPDYALVYPFIELGLGLAYLSGVAPTATAWATVVVFSFGTFGVISALRRGLDIDCPCMGSILSVPLSTVTLTEDLAMVVMAAALLAGLM